MVFVKSDVSEEFWCCALGRALQVAALGVLQQLLHFGQFAPITGERRIEEATQRSLQDWLDTALNVTGKLHQVRTILQLHQPLNDDVDGVPAKGGEGAGRVGRHDGLDAGRELGGLLPVEHRIKPHAPLWERRMELEESVG